MKATRLLWILGTYWFIISCSKDAKDNSGVDSGANSHTGTCVDSGATSDSGAMGGGPCGEAGICPLEVENALVTGCDVDTGVSSELVASFNSSGGLDVVHTAAEIGCCPEFNADAELSLRNDTLLVNYHLSNDFCDCVCNLSLSYTLTGIPEGVGFTLSANGSSLVVEGR
jgi:hypothetical protein